MEFLRVFAHCGEVFRSASELDYLLKFNTNFIKYFLTDYLSSSRILQSNIILDRRSDNYSILSRSRSNKRWRLARYSYWKRWRKIGRGCWEWEKFVQSDFHVTLNRKYYIRPFKLDQDIFFWLPNYGNYDFCIEFSRPLIIIFDHIWLIQYKSNIW